jgi:hypothetical protein
VTLLGDLNPDSTGKIIAAIVNWNSGNTSLWTTAAEHEAWLKKLFSDTDSVVDSGLMDAKVNITDNNEKDKVKKIIKSMKRGAGGLGLAVYKRVQEKTACSPCAEGDPPPPPENY